MQQIEIESRIQRIYFTKDDGKLLSTIANAPKRISIKNAKDILSSRNVDFKEVIKVQYEVIKLDFDVSELLAKIK